MLSIRGLVKVYPGPVAALQGVDLDVPMGMFGLLGPNGAGKSTLMRILAGLLEPTSGSVRFNGSDVLADPAAVRRTLGYLPQDFGFYPHLSGEQMLRHLLVLKGVTSPHGLKALTTELLDRVNLSFAAKRAVKSYSGGMRQRLGIAQAIAGDPKLVIVDEPTAGLDPEERVRFLNLLAELGQNSIVILSTHIVDDVSELCSRVAIIDRGRIRLEDDPQAAVTRLHGRIWRRVVSRDELARHQERFAVLSTKLLAGRTVVRVRSDQRPEAGYELAEPGLEDVYFAAMRGAHAPDVPFASEPDAAAPAFGTPGGS